MKLATSTRVSLTASILLVLATTSAADLRLASLFTDHMVFQRETDAPVWGWADPGERVVVSATWSGDPVSATADEDGRWQVVLTTPEAGGPYEVAVKTGGGEELTLGDVLVGEVWIASGQSNMEWPLRAADGGLEEIEMAYFPGIRIFDVAHRTALAPAATCVGTWVECAPGTVGAFSAVAYFFGRELHLELDVPIGLVGSNWGGTVAEAWTGASTLRTGFPEFDETLDRIAEAAVDSTKDATDSDEAWFHQNSPTALFNGMIAPLVPFAVRGVIWYQGESNIPRAAQYRRLFPAMIGDWRGRWGRGDFPFYFVQIAPFAYDPDGGQAAELREAQAMTLATANTGMVVTMDIGNPQDIHPRNKLDVGLRLARHSLSALHGRDVEASGPVLVLSRPEAGALRLSFEHAAGLTSHDELLRGFTIAGTDQVFHPAEAVVEGETVLVSSPEVPAPVAVRFGWGAADETNLWNGVGLPASSFRTDEWETVSAKR